MNRKQLLSNIKIKINKYFDKFRCPKKNKLFKKPNALYSFELLSVNITY